MNIEKLINNPYFEKQTLTNGELLFDEGDLNDNLYIVLNGSLKVEKYVDKDRKDTKLLAIIKESEIIGEGIFSEKNTKKVKITSNEETELLKIDKNNFKKLIVKDPSIGMEILIYIINLTNNRLLESNLFLTTVYNISKIISEKVDFNNKSLFEIIDEILNILSINYILVFEKNPILYNYLKLTYDSRKKGKIGNKVIELKGKLDEDLIKSNGIELVENNFMIELINKNENVGYLVFGEKEKEFDETQKKMINSISTLIAGFIRQKQYFEEKKCRD